MVFFWRPLTLVACLVALSAQPSLARTHSAASRHSAYRHYGHNRFVRADDDTGQQNSWQEGSWQQQDSWQQNTSRQRQDFASNPASRGYAEASPTRYDRRSRQYEQGWNSRTAEQSFGNGSQLQSMAEQQASANGIPTSLVDRVIARESGGNPRAVSRGNYGLMQIRLGTARAMGYGGSAAGLLDASTNMTYAVRYLAGAYRAAGGNESRAVALYARGYRAPRAQDASYDGGRQEGAAFNGGADGDSFAEHRMVRRSRHSRHRMS
jgi:soluble lytic murein transglycosylase-like protein